jgi:hypothetical protein
MCAIAWSDQDTGIDCCSKSQLEHAAEGRCYLLCAAIQSGGSWPTVGRCGLGMLFGIRRPPSQGQASGWGGAELFQESVS